MSSQSITCTCIFYIGTWCQRSLHADLSLNKEGSDPCAMRKTTHKTSS